MGPEAAGRDLYQRIVGTLGSQQLPKEIQILGFLLLQLPGYEERRQGNARLYRAGELQTAMEPPPGQQGKPIQFAFGKCELRHIELRTQQPQFALQSADDDAEYANLICQLEHLVLKHRYDAQFHRQPLAEHARFIHRHDAARPQHQHFPLLSVQKKEDGGR